MTRNETKQGYKTVFQMAEKKGPGQISAAMKELCKTDLFFLLVNILGRIDCDRDWIFDRCREVQNRPNGMIDLWAREHYKSTIITLALTIQDIINDPEITVGIFSHTRPVAKAFLRQIKRELEGNAKLRSLFPDILYDNPQKESPKWSEDEGITVKRTSNPKEATVEAWGILDGQPTGRHFRLMIYDDLVTRENVTTPEMIHKTTDSWALSLNLGSDGGVIRYIGTYYHFNDTYHEIIARGSAIPRIYPATDTGKVTGKPILIHPDDLSKKRKDMGPYIFSCQMLLNPVADEVQSFKFEWLKFWNAIRYHNLNRIILCDPASEKKKYNDYTVFMVIGLGLDENFYIIDIIRDRLSLTERANTLFKLHRDYHPIHQVGYEKYGMQADIEYFKTIMDKENYNFTITELGGQVPKADRIKSLIPLFEYGRILLPERIIHVNYEGKKEDLSRIFQDEEYKTFPVSIHDDMMDCLARINDPLIYKIWPMGHGGFINQQTEASNYDPLTGLDFSALQARQGTAILDYDPLRS
jgi:phage terminase large subunit-like protein